MYLVSLILSSYRETVFKISGTSTWRLRLPSSVAVPRSPSVLLLWLMRGLFSAPVSCRCIIDFLRRLVAINRCHKHLLCSHTGKMFAFVHPACMPALWNASHWYDLSIGLGLLHWARILRPAGKGDLEWSCCTSSPVSSESEMGDRSRFVVYSQSIRANLPPPCLFGVKNK